MNGAPAGIWSSDQPLPLRDRWVLVRNMSFSGAVGGAVVGALLGAFYAVLALLLRELRRHAPQRP